MANKLVSTNEYLSFRNAVPLKRIIVDDDDSKVWGLYDAGPRTVKCPIICLPPAAGRADVFYRQLLGLSAKGYRAIALDYPVYWNIEQFCIGLRKVIDHLRLEHVHIFGCSLGGYLALKFAERVRNSSFVASLIVCNGFTDTSVFKLTRAATAFWLIPGFLLKRMVMGSLSKAITDAPQADATDFVVDCLESLSQQEISSRLVLHCNGDYLSQPHSIQNVPITIMDVFDESVLSQSVKDDMYKCFPYSKCAHLKSGGNFPYLSRSDEVNLHLQVHLKPFESTNKSPQTVSSFQDPSMQSYEPQTLRGVSRNSSFDKRDDEESTEQKIPLQMDDKTASTLIKPDQLDDEDDDFPI